MKQIGLELFKLRTQRATIVILFFAFVLAMLGFVGLIVSIKMGAAVGFELTNVAVQRQLLGAGGGSTLVVVLAVIGITSEYRHRTITSTFLGTPERYSVLFAKLAAYVLVAVMYGIFLACIVTAGTLIFLSIENITLLVPWSQILRDYARDLGLLAMYAGFGLGIGALVANQVGAIVIVLVEPFVSSILSGFLPQVGKWAPSQAAAAFVTETEFIMFEGLLSRGVGGLVFLGYVLLAFAGAIFVTQRRDIT